jgi:hypothetical protein
VIWKPALTAFSVAFRAASKNVIIDRIRYVLVWEQLRSSP